MNVLAFAATSSSKSINKSLVTYAANLLNDANVNIIDLNDYSLPIFSEDIEAEIGKPQLAHDFLTAINNADAIIISFAEHNGSYAAAYKNIFDWCSRINPKVYQNKPVILLSTSPGPGGASTVLNTAVSSMSYFGGIVKGIYSLPSFYDNFDIDTGEISNPEMAAELTNIIGCLHTHQHD